MFINNSLEIRRMRMQGEKPGCLSRIIKTDETEMTAGCSKQRLWREIPVLNRRQC